VSRKEVVLRIARHRPTLPESPRWATYTLRVGEEATILDCLEEIRLQHDATLVYRHSCHHAACGTCACRIDGVERLACITSAAALESAPITVEPLRGFAPEADLAVDRRALFEKLDPEWPYLRDSGDQGSERASLGGRPFSRFENCIECGCCESACPVVRQGDHFLGPTTLAAIHREILKGSPDAQRLLELAAGKRGERWCSRALACSRVCPSAVYPARHIAGLRKRLAVDGAR
jgi:succinate dehydrogenase / fumarate reductase iron-sulfur subunit